MRNFAGLIAEKAFESRARRHAGLSPDSGPTERQAIARHRARRYAGGGNDWAIVVGSSGRPSGSKLFRFLIKRLLPTSERDKNGLLPFCCPIGSTSRYCPTRPRRSERCVDPFGHLGGG